MRTVSSDLLNQMDADRTIGASITVRDNRLRFALSTITSIDTTSLAPNVKNIDSDVYSGGILRAANINNTLYWQYLSNPDSPSGSWNNTSRALLANSKVAVYGNRIFYQNSSGQLYYSDYSGSLGSAASFGGTYSYPASLAPVSSTELYVIYFTTAATYTRSTLIYRSSGGTVQTFYGQIYGSDQTRPLMDAVRFNNRDYIFFNDSDGKRGMVVTHIVSGPWSEIRPVMPLDVVDQHNYKIAGAAVINSRIFISGIIARETGIKMHFYSMGPAPFTAGRDLYVGDFGTDTYQSGGATYPALGGKLHLVGSKVYYVTFGFLYKCDGTRLVGYAPGTTYERSIAGVNTVSMEYVPDEGARLSMDIPPSEYGTAPLAAGSEVDVNVSYGAYSTKIGTFGIDAVAFSRESTGNSLSIAGRSQGIKALSQWEPDVSFDLWSQTKQACDPALLTEMVRVTGDWGTNGSSDLILQDLNVAGVCYTVKRAARGTVARAKFYNPSLVNPLGGGADDPATGFSGRFGVAVNYYHESYLDQMRHNGIFAVYSELNNRIYLYRVYRDNWTEITNVSVTLAKDNWVWIMLELREGHVIVRTKTDAATTWTDQIDTVLTTYPWMRDDVGRGALMVENVTPKYVSPGLSSTGMIIPLDPSGGLPSSSYNGLIMMDDEQIVVNGASADNGISEPSFVPVVEATTWPNANHRNTSWIGHDIFMHPWNNSGAVYQNLCDTADFQYVTRSFTVKGKAKIRSVIIPLGKVGSPTVDPHVFIATDAFDDGSPNHAAILGDAAISRTSVGTTIAAKAFDFATPIEIENDNFWIVVTNCASGGSPTVNASNYYRVAVDADFTGKDGLFTIWGSTSGWRSRGDYALMPFTIKGDAVWRTPGYEIHVTGAGITSFRNLYNNYALYVNDGPGKGTAFTIIDYDLYAPDDWVPNRTYKSPDRWEDHVGDTNHGAWTANSRQRFWVSENPRGIIGNGSIVTVYPAMLVQTRGYNSTTPTTHAWSNGNATVSVFRDASVSVDAFEYFSTDIDQSLEDVARNLARKAGVYNLTSQMDVNISATTSQTGWSRNNIDTFGGAKTRSSFIAKVTRTSGSGFPGVAFWFTGTGVSDYSLGYIIVVTSSYVELYLDVSSPTLQLRVPLSYTYGGEITYSVNNAFCSVWMDGCHLATFNVGSSIIKKVGFMSYNGCTFTAQLSVADQRIDNFIFDAGTRGTQLLQRLIGEKRIHFQDDNDGGIKLWKNRASIPGSYSLTAMENLQTVDTDLVTRIQAEGIDIAERYAAADLANYGNLFHLMNINEADTKEEMEIQADFILSEIKANLTRRTIAGAADPRVEPGDLLSTVLPSGTVNLAVDTVKFALAVTENNAMFDMEVSAHDV